MSERNLAFTSSEYTTLSALHTNMAETLFHPCSSILNRNDPEQAENDHLRGRIAELEQVVRELRQKSSRSAVASNSGQTLIMDDSDKVGQRDSKKRKLELEDVKPKILQNGEYYKFWLGR